MALSFGRRKLRGERETGGHGRCRCRHFHVHYHLPRKRVCTFSLLRWLPRLSLLSCVLIPLVLFFAVLAFVASFVCFTLLYFVASLLDKDSHHESCKDSSFGRASGDVDNHRREGGVHEGKPEAKGKSVKHAAELLTGDSATAETGARKLEIKEVYVDGFSQLSRSITRIASTDDSLNCEVRTTNNDRIVEILSIFETGSEGMHVNVDLEEFCGRHEVQDVPLDGFMDEHNIRSLRSSTSGDLLPSVYSINSLQIHDLPDMNEVIEMSPDFLVGSNQNMVVPSNTSSHHNINATNQEFGVEDRKELSDCTPYEIIDFIDKHETGDHGLGSSFAKDEIVELLTSSDCSVHGRVPDEHNIESLEEKDVDSVSELLIDSVTTQEHFDEQRVPDFPIIQANTKQSVAASDEVHDFSNENETSELSLYYVSEDASSHHEIGYEDDKHEEAIENNIVEVSDPASVACDFVDNHQTETQALDDSVNAGSTGEVVSRASSEDEADKVNDNNSSSQGARRGLPLLRRSPSQWWNLCGVVDVFAGSED